MTHLTVSVRLNGTVVEQRLLPVRDGLRLGEAPDAQVHFPGADLILRVVEGRLWIRGRSLGAGDTYTMSLGAVRLHVEVHDRAFGLVWLARRLDNVLDGRPVLPDARVFLASAVVLLAVASADAMVRFVSVDPVASAQVQAWRQVLSPVDTRNARIEAPEQPSQPEASPEQAPRDPAPPPVGFQP